MVMLFSDIDRLGRRSLGKVVCIHLLLWGRLTKQSAVSIFRSCRGNSQGCRGIDRCHVAAFLPPVLFIVLNSAQAVDPQILKAKTMYQSDRILKSARESMPRYMPLEGAQRRSCSLDGFDATPAMTQTSILCHCGLIDSGNM